MNKKKEELRLIPLSKEFISNRNIIDKVWTYLQLNSYITEIEGEKKRYIIKRNPFSYNFLYNLINDKIKSENKNTEFCSYNTFVKSVKELENHKFIESGKLNIDNTEKDVFFLNEVIPNKLIPKETLDFLMVVSNINVIKIYAYLLNKSGFKENYTFSQKEIATVLGYSEKSNVAIKKIGYILEALQSFGLIEYHYEMRITPKGTKTKYRILDKVNDYRTSKKEIFINGVSCSRNGEFFF